MTGFNNTTQLTSWRCIYTRRRHSSPLGILFVDTVELNYTYIYIYVEPTDPGEGVVLFDARLQ